MMRPETLSLGLEEPARAAGTTRLGPAAVVLTAFAQSFATELLTGICGICRRSPLRHMLTPGGWKMSVAMTNCGEAGWVADRTGYRYDRIDPETATAWPAMPASLRAFATAAAAEAGFAGFIPDACLINQYHPGARLSLHQDRNEEDLTAPIVSVSLGLPAVFLWGGHKRADRSVRVPLMHGDVVVWGGVDRLRFHGVHSLGDGTHPQTGAVRYNLTFRKAR
ncbi:MAG TPA: DNA oxidative demethylase AlkB [Steroidobacteraceae bacterium]